MACFCIHILVEKNLEVWCFLIKIPQVGHFVAKISTYALQEWNFGAFWPNLDLENIVKISRYIASNEISLKYRVYRKKNNIAHGWSYLNVFCSLQSMSSLRSPTSPPQASRSEFINFTTFDCTGCSPGSLPEDHRKVRLPGELVNWMMIQSICGENSRNFLSKNICLHFSLSWRTRIWYLRRESYIIVASIGSFWQ